MNNYFENRILKTAIEYLIEFKCNDIASLLVDANLIIEDNTPYGYDDHWNQMTIDLTITSYNIVEQNEYYKKGIVKALNNIVNKYRSSSDALEIIFRIKLTDIEDNWREKVKDLILNSKNSNQGNITETVFKKQSKEPYLYREMKFASKTEIRIAQELEDRKVLFFPLALAVRADTGNIYEDHREADFLVCQNGIWGIMEVSFHSGRYEKDSEKAYWFKKSGILCVEHYTAERCYNQPKEVVDGCS